MIRISPVFGIACLTLLAYLAFTVKDNTVLLAIRDFFIFMGVCGFAWVIIGLNSNHPKNLRNYIVLDDNDELPPRKIPYTPHTTQTIGAFIQAGRK